MTQYIHQQIIIQLRIPIQEDGTAGKPEILKRFITDFKGNYKKKPKTQTTFKPEQSDEVYL